MNGNDERGMNLRVSLRLYHHSSFIIPRSPEEILWYDVSAAHDFVELDGLFPAAATTQLQTLDER